MTSKPKVYVLNNNTLGYIYAETPHRFEILRARLDSPHCFPGIYSCAAPIDGKGLVPATKQDFDDFRVDSKGFID